MVVGAARADQPDEQAGRGDPLRVDPLGGLEPVPRRRTDRDRLEHGRAHDPAPGPDAQECNAGAEHWAVIASLVETCKLVGVEPRAYLADVITCIVEGYPNRRFDDLLPWAYPPIPALRDVA
jgi:hypothetical protein